MPSSTELAALQVLDALEGNVAERFAVIRRAMGCGRGVATSALFNLQERGLAVELTGQRWRLTVRGRQAATAQEVARAE